MTLGGIRTVVAMAMAGLCAVACGQASPVALENVDGGWRLSVEGQPFFIQGAGGDASKELLKQVGGNAFRTWGAGEDTQAKLDEAQRIGLKVVVGIWLGHERHGFNYADAAAVARQKEEARKWVLRYKDHPALLMWGLGNEMEGFGQGDNPLIWKAVNDIAVMVREIDPKHPTMTTMAEIGGKKVEMVHSLCPDVQVVGINSYGGGPSLARRYRSAGGTKPYVICEYGPGGTWEVAKNAWGVPIELTSTKKGDAYRATYRESILAEKDKLCLGGFAFAWGSKQEATATWFGMLLPDGSRLEAVDAMQEMWTGKPPANRCPQIEPLTLETQELTPGATLKVTLKVSDPEADALRVNWILQKDPGEYETGGDTRQAPPIYPEAIKRGELDGAEVVMPNESGRYWVYAYVRDTNGGAAMANAPVQVK